MHPIEQRGLGAVLVRALSLLIAIIAAGYLLMLSMPQLRGPKWPISEAWTPVIIAILSAVLAIIVPMQLKIRQRVFMALAVFLGISAYWFGQRFRSS